MLPSAANAPVVYTVEEFASLLGYGKSTVHKRIRTGDLRAVKDGSNMTRILRADAEAFLASLPAVTPRNPKP